MEREPHKLDGPPPTARDELAAWAEALVADGHQVVTDGLLTFFLTEEDTERLLTDQHFGAIAMGILHMSGVLDGPLHDL